MEFRETSVFTRQLQRLMPDDEYLRLQQFMNEDPEAGSVIPGSGGLRKLRWAGNGHGKRGGLRIIYYYWVPGNLLYLLTVYAKNEMDDLPDDAYQRFRKMVEKELP